ncbi:MAG TPA: ubiquitin-like domain-containing protein [Pseudogracilibacillus sp.]|nr:ubiquitin-like domain-containing protein [Pseudogracilibacillus sp.]
MQNILKPLLAVKNKSRYSVITAIVVALFSTWATFEATKTEVVLAADGDVQVVKTHATTVGELFDELSIDVSEHDALSHDEDEQIVDGMNINYKMAKRVTVTVDGETTDYYSTALTVGKFLDEQQIEIGKQDYISHYDRYVLKDDTEITIEHAIPVTLYVGGEKEKVWTTANTVGELLDENDIEFNDKIDKVKPDVDKTIKEDMKIKVTYVTKEEVQEEETIPFDTKEEKDSSLEKGKTKVITEGENGKIAKTFKVTKENGKEVDRTLVEEEVIKESVTKVVAVGTKEAPKQTASANSSASADSSGKQMTVVATAYTASCSGCSGVTATGINLNKNPNMKVISVDPSVIPLGSRVWVEGYGEAIAGDTGGAIKGNRIDLHMPSKGAANSWGRRTVTIKMLN